MTDTILVADNEPDILRFVEVNLRLEGFDVVLAGDGEEALGKALTELPALILLDVMMPKLDGFEVCRRLRADARTSQIPVIILTAKAMTGDKVLGLASGADDYVLKPFDPVELVARVQTTLRRTRELRATSPLTGLPGNYRIDDELALRLGDGQPLALIYADLNDFKAFNDHYGFLRGDDVIALTARILRDALEDEAGQEGFAGHIGGDDFMLICPPEAVTRLCRRIIAEFDRSILAMYDPEDAARGYLEIPDRQGNPKRYPITSITLGVATTERRQFADHREVVAVATEMKSYLKQQATGSAYAVDGRANTEDAA